MIQKNFTVLIIDDIPDNIQVIGYTLMEYQIDSIAALDGQSGIDIALEKDIDLILLDIAMPNMDGYQVCSILKSNPKTREIPIIFLSARNQTNDIVRGFELGAVDYISKPFNSQELIQRVQTHLNLKHSREVISNQNSKLIQRNKEITALFEGAKSILSGNSIQEKAGIIFTTCKNLINAQAGYIALIDSERKALEKLFPNNYSDVNIFTSKKNTYTTQISSLEKSACTNLKTVFDNNLQKECTASFSEFCSTKIDNILCAPLIADNHAVGILTFYNKPNGFVENDIQLTTTFAEYAAIALISARSVEKVVESEIKFRQLFEAIVDPLYILDTNGTFISANKIACEKLEYTIEEIVNKNITEIEVGISVEHTYNIINRLKSEGKILYESRHITKNGRIFPVEVHSKLINFNNKPVVLEVVRDITLRKLQEKEIQASEEKFRSFFEHSPAGIAITDCKGNYKLVNQAFSELVGYSAEELLTMNFRNLIHPDDLNEEVSRNRLLLKENKKYIQSQKRYIHKNGHTLWGLLNVAIIKSDNSKTLHYLGQVIDITAAKENEAEILKLSTAIDQSASIIIITDKKGIIEYVNKRFVVHTGYSHDFIIGKRTNIFKTGVHTKEYYEKMWQTISSGEIWRGELYNKKRNGEFYWEDVNITPIKNEKNEIVNYIAVKEDITERKIAEKREKEYKKQLEDINRNLISSINYAKLIQNAVLPSENYLSGYLPENFILNLPKDIVSGDFYWTKESRNLIFIAAADCTGHGVPGAFMSMLGITFLQDILNKHNWNTEIAANNILNILRENIKTALNQKNSNPTVYDGMDIALCIIDSQQNTMQFAGANNPVFIVRKDAQNTELLAISPDKMPIAVHISERPFKNNFIQLQKNDTIYLFSDGFADQFGGKHGRKFLLKNFKNLLIEISGFPMCEQKDILYTTFIDWKGNNEQVDDILIIGFKNIYEAGNMKV